MIGLIIMTPHVDGSTEIPPEIRNNTAIKCKNFIIKLQSQGQHIHTQQHSRHMGGQQMYTWALRGSLEADESTGELTLQLGGWPCRDTPDALRGEVSHRSLAMRSMQDI